MEAVALWPRMTVSIIRASSYRAGAASKPGIITPDLVQHMNRIVEIARQTEITTTLIATLPALVRDCAKWPTRRPCRPRSD